MNKEIKKLNNQKGFTLVELIVVIAILGILAAVAVPNYMNYQRRSRINTDVSTAGEIIRAARTQIIETGAASVPGLSDIDEVSNLKPISGGSTFDVGGSTGSNGITVSFTASNCGDYNGTYKVEEGNVEATKAKKSST
jgi:type IV pilus assembly protein PilA